MPIHQTSSPAGHTKAAPGQHMSYGLRLAAIVAITLGLGAAAYVLKVSEKMVDFDVYLTAGARALAGEPLYRADDGHYQFKYLPAFAMFVAPLALLEAPVARAGWFVLSLALLPALLAISLELVGQRRKTSFWLVALTVAVLGKFFAHELVLGQVNLLFTVVAAGAVLLLSRERDVLGGALVAVALVLKPYGVVLAPWVVARRRWRSSVALLIGLAGALVLPCLRYGLAGGMQLHRDWWNTVVSTTAPNLLNPDNVSWMAMYARWVGEGPLASGLAAATTAMGALAAVWVWAVRGRVSRPDPLEGGLALLFIPFVSPQGWDYVLLVATPAVMLLINWEGSLPKVLRWPTIVALGVIGLSIYDLMGRTAYRAFMMLSGITVCFALVIAALVALRAKRLA